GNHGTPLKHNACGKIPFESGTVPPLLESFTSKNPEITGTPLTKSQSHRAGSVASKPHFPKGGSDG
ncbi:MAG: hypothetical protein J7555_05650, partial [Chloroflexi bacterium]|nr:hypothetical protein [Chloroflexota bacterium]